MAYDDDVKNRNGRQKWQFGFVIFLLCFQIACASSTPVAGGGDSAVSDSRKELTPACPPRMKLAEDWKTVSNETGEYELRVPASLRKAPADKYFFVHGGEVWEDDDTRVSLAFGHWAEYSFAEEVGERCRVALDAQSVFLIVRETAVIAWYDRQSGQHEPAIRASSNSMPEEALAGIALSLVYHETKPRTP